MFVCPLAYLENRTAELHQIFARVAYSAVARSSCGGIAIRNVLPVLWITLCLHLTHGASWVFLIVRQDTSSCHKQDSQDSNQILLNVKD